MEFYNIKDDHNKNSYCYLIGEIFENNQNVSIKPKDLNREYLLNSLIIKCEKNNMDDKTLEYFKIIKKFIKEKNISIPGDVQRNVRTFFNKHKNHGLEKKNNEYIYNPILINNIKNNDIAPRTFPNEFMLSKIKKIKGACEMCKDDSTKLFGDHWRPHSIYNDSSNYNCIMLCEKCNNTKSNKYGSGIYILYKWFTTKGKCDFLYNNFIKIEERINKNGLYPNEEDKKSINNILIECGYKKFY